MSILGGLGAQLPVEHDGRDDGVGPQRVPTKVSKAALPGGALGRWAPAAPWAMQDAGTLWVFEPQRFHSFA